MIRFLKHYEIDKQKWDEAIVISSSKSIYALSWYLDCVSPCWCALVEDEYISCMPLPINAKWGIPLITQPILTQQLGVFFTEKSTSLDCTSWLKKIPRKFLLIRLCLNTENAKNKLIIGIRRTNYLLSLSQSYEEIQQKFTNDCKRNIAKALNKNAIISEISIDEAFAFFKQENSLFNNEKSKKVFNCLHSRKLLQIQAIIENDKLMSVAFFVKSFSSYIYMASCTNETGRKGSANYLLIDSFIKSNCNTETILDFEGSSIESIAKFFAGFGAVKTEYVYLKKWNLY